MNTRNPQNNREHKRREVILPRKNFLNYVNSAQFDPAQKVLELEHKYKIRKLNLRQNLKQLNIFEPFLGKKGISSYVLIALILVSIITPLMNIQHKVSASSQGPNTSALAGDCVEDAATGTTAWSNVGDAYKNDGNTAFTSMNGTSSRYIKCTNFGFAIPTGATIDGIVAGVERRCSGASACSDNTVRAVKGGVIGTTGKQTATLWTTSDTFEDHGGVADLWGLAWTAADINASNFGIAFSAKATSGGAKTGFVDNIRVTVYYTYTPPTASYNYNVNQNGYIWENDDSANSASIQAAGNTAITGVRKGERLGLRMQVKNTGANALSTNLGLFYDQNDGNFVKVNSPTAKSVTGSGCADSAWTCTAVDTTNQVGMYSSMAFSPSGSQSVAFRDASNSDLRFAQYVGTGGTGCATTAWTCTTIESTNSVGTYSSLAFSPNGIPYISYYDNTNFDLRVAQFVGSGGTGCAVTTWTCTTVDSTNNVGQFSAIAFSPSGAPYVSYVDVAPNNDLRVAQFVGSGGTGCATATWTCTGVNTAAQVGNYTSIAFSPTGQAYVSYYNSSSGDLLVAQNVGSGGTGCAVATWTCTSIDTANGVGSYNSIAFSPDGTAYIAYHDATTVDLKIAQNVGSGGTGCAVATWTCTVVDSNNSTGLYPALAFSPGGDAYVSYSRLSGGDLVVAHYVGSGGTGCALSTWTCTDVDTTNSVGTYTSIAFSPDGAPFVSYHDDSNFDLRVANLARSGAITYSASTQTGSITSSHSDMTTVTDSGNKTDADCIGGGTWANGIIATGPEVTVNLASGACTEILFMVDTSQASYGTTYRFVVGNGGSLRNDKGKWKGPASIASGAYATLTVASDSDDVSVRIGKDTEAQFASCYYPSSWKCANIDTSANNYPGNVAFAPDGTPYIALATGTDVKLAKYVGTGGSGCSNTAWTCTLVDDGTVGGAPQLAFSRAGVPYIAYSDTTNQDLKVAQYVGSGGTGCGATTAWTCVKVDGAGNQSVGDAGSSIEFSPSDVPYVAYNDNTNSDIKIAQYVGPAGGTGCADINWTCSTIDGSTTSTFNPSLAFNKFGTPSVSYIDGTNSKTRLAQSVGSGGSGCSNSAWSCSDVDGGNSFTSLAYDLTGVAYIAYTNSATQQIKVSKFVGSGGSGCTSAAWTCTVVNSVGSNETITLGQGGLAISPSGLPTLVYDVSQEYSVGLFDGLVIVSQYNGASWTGTTLSYNQDNYGGRPSVAYSQSGAPFMAEYDFGTQKTIIAKLQMSTEKLIGETTYTYPGTRNGVRSEGRYHLADGRSGRNAAAFGNCAGSTTALMGHCGIFNDDGNTDSITAQINERPVYNFSFNTKSSTELPTVSWVGRTTLAPNTAGVTGDLKLQVYRFGTTNAWVDVASDSASTNCSTANCKLSGIPSGPVAEYFEADGSDYRVYFRVYQTESASTSITLSVDSIQGQMLSKQMRHGMRIQNGVKLGATW